MAKYSRRRTPRTERKWGPATSGRRNRCDIERGRLGREGASAAPTFPGRSIDAQATANPGSGSNLPRDATRKYPLGVYRRDQPATSNHVELSAKKSSIKEDTEPS